MSSGITHLNHLVINYHISYNLLNSLILIAASTSWEKCWEKILQLTIQEYYNAGLLYAEAKRIVRDFCSDAESSGVKLLETEIKDAQSFVAEQFALDPESREWQRIDVVLAGAEAGLTRDC